MVKTATKNTKYALIGGYGHGNLGDDALMLANVSVLSLRVSRDDITIVIRRPAPKHDYVKKFMPDCSITSILPEDEIQCENIIYGGGTMFRAFPEIKKNFLQRTRKAVRACVTNPAYVARRVVIEQLRSQSYPKVTAIRSFGLGIGLGPFIDNGHNIQEAKAALHRCRYLSVRDGYSESLCRQWGIGNAMQRADLCFCPQLWGSVNNEPRNKHGKLKRIGVVFRDWKHTNGSTDYKYPLLETVKLLRKKGYYVKYVSFQKGSNLETELLNDESEVLAYSPYNSSVPEFVEALRQFDLIITARAHGAILAATLGIPSVCIEIEPKLKYVSESLGKGGKLWHQPFNECELLATIEEVSDNLSYCREQARIAAKTNRNLAELSIFEFLQVL